MKVRRVALARPVPIPNPRGQGPPAESARTTQQGADSRRGCCRRPLKTGPWSARSRTTSPESCVPDMGVRGCHVCGRSPCVGADSPMYCWAAIGPFAAWTPGMADSTWFPWFLCCPCSQSCVESLLLRGSKPICAGPAAGRTQAAAPSQTIGTSSRASVAEKNRIHFVPC